MPRMSNGEMGDCRKGDLDEETRGKENSRRLD